MAGDSQVEDVVNDEVRNSVDSKKEKGEPQLVRIENEEDALAVAAAAGWEIDAEISRMEEQLKELKPTKHWWNWEVNFKDPRHFTWLLTCFACMGGFLSGIDQSLISGANIYMPDDLNLTTSQKSFVSSGMPLGAVGGALLLSPANELLGRKLAIIWACVLYTIGAALEAGATNFGIMIAGRLVLGVGLGLEGGTVPVYVAESVQRKYRGNLVSLYQFMIALGEVFGYIVAAIFVKVPGNWRYMLGSSLIFSTIMFFGMLVMPESPRFLMHKGHQVESFAVWKRIRGLDDEGKQEFFVMKYASEAEKLDADKRKGQHTWVDFFTVPRARRALVYANMMVFLGQFTGVNAIMYYMAVLMKQIGFNDEQSVFMSLVGGVSLMLGTIPAIFYMEKYGRRFWANAMLPGFFIGLVVIGCSYQIPLSNTSAAEGCYIAGLVIYMLFFGCYSCLTWVIPSEVYPTYLRSYGMTTSDAILFGCSFLVTYFFYDMQDGMTRIGLTLGFYGGIAVIGWFYQLLFMPETKNRTLEEIDLIFSQPTHLLVKQNLKNVSETVSDLCHFRLKKVFSPVDQDEDIRAREAGSRRSSNVDKA